MSIIYSVITKDLDKVISEYSEFQGNFEQISRTLLKKVEEEHRATFSYDDTYFFHYINQENLTYMCMCEVAYPKAAAFKYLEELKALLFETLPRTDIFGNKPVKFASRIKGLQQYRNSHFDKTDNISKLKEGVYGFKSDVAEAGNNLMIRGEKAKIVVDKAENLRSDSQSYFRTAKKVKTNVKRKRIIIIAAIVLILLLIGYFISVIACKGFAWQGCRSSIKTK